MTRWVLGHRITPQKTTGDFDLVTGETPTKPKAHHPISITPITKYLRIPKVKWIVHGPK